jgi:hypothetical protein
MASDNTAETRILGHDIMLLAQPYFQAPALTHVAAGTAIQPLRYVDGFFSIQYAQQQGFLPAALCSSSTKLHSPPQGAWLTLEHSEMLWPSLAASTAPSRPHMLAAGESVLVLGHDSNWRLVQRRDGCIGFLAPARIAAQEARLSGTPVGCIDATVWIGAGLGWATVNWLGMQRFLLAVAFVSPRWEAILTHLVALGVLIAMWRGPRRDPERIFIVGVLILVISMLLAMCSVV